MYFSRQGRREKIAEIAENGIKPGCYHEILFGGTSPIAY